MDEKIASMRVDYRQGFLVEENISPDPFTQFKGWFNEAVERGVKEPNIMVLSTVNEHKRPESRVVLLKDIKENGFTFFTNYNSSKGRAIEQNPAVSLLFIWVELQRQVRIEGMVSKLDRLESEAYFNSRPIESRIGAVISNQSSVIESRSVLDDAYQKLFLEYTNGKEISMPKHWGGYFVKPDLFEFWQGRASRLHDRIVYTAIKDSNWLIQRLAP